MTSHENYLVSLIKQTKMSFNTAKCKVIKAGSLKANLMAHSPWIKRDNKKEILSQNIGAT